VSDLLDLRDERPPPRGRRRRKGSGAAKAIAVAVVLLLTLALVAGVVLVGQRLMDRFESAPDFEGAGSGEVLVEVEPGETAGDIARTLQEKGVIKSVTAFNEAAMAEPRSRGLQPGFYNLRLMMSAESALELLLDPASQVKGRVTLPEGLTVPQTLETLAKGTEIPLADFEKAVEKAEDLGLPDYADGRLEGFLFPATYDIDPGSTAEDVLTAVFDRFAQAAEKTDLEARAEELGYSPYEVITVASLIEREVRFDDEYPKVARVVYNRLEQRIPLGIDAAILFGLGRTSGELTRSDLAKDTPYENRRKAGLPPTPIASPGEATIEAALNPEPGDFLYYVLATKEGRTFFTEDYNAFLRQKDKSIAEGVF
jgi:UPF0755 protein